MCSINLRSKLNNDFYISDLRYVFKSCQCEKHSYHAIPSPSIFILTMFLYKYKYIFCYYMERERERKRERELIITILNV